MTYDPDQIQALYVTPHRWTPYFRAAAGREVIQKDARRWDYKHQVLSTRHLPPWRVILAGCVLAAIVVAAAGANWLAPYPFDELHVADRLHGPSLTYLAGTDEYGRDVLSRTLYGGRLSLFLGIAATAIGRAAGVPVGWGEPVVEGRIRPPDIAFIRPNQDAVVKISAYDSNVYGHLNGKVERISADTIADEKSANNKEEKAETFYRVMVRTDTNHLGSPEHPLPIIPGMVATVEVLTGHKTVLDYLIKPARLLREEALRER